MTGIKREQESELLNSPGNNIEKWVEFLGMNRNAIDCYVHGATGFPESLMQT